MAMEPQQTSPTCLEWMELGCQVLFGHFGPVDILQVSKIMTKNIASKRNLALVDIFIYVLKIRHYIKKCKDIH